jgi:hypothetical protein
MVFFGNSQIYAVEMAHLMSDLSLMKQASSEGDFDLIK